MLPRFANLFATLRRNQSAARPAGATKRPRTFRPAVEGLEDRAVPSISPLHVAGNQLKDAANNTVTLRGVNIISLEWRTDGDNVLSDGGNDAVHLAINDWHANLLRLPVNEDFWFGHNAASTNGAPDDDGSAYRNLVKQIIDTAAANNVYVMLDLHWSDMGAAGTNNGQHFMPDDNSTAFWQDAASTYGNNAAVLFDPYNEPHFASDQPTDAEFATWQNGGWINETGQFNGGYNSPGMQNLINTIRDAGANNIVAPEGLNWGSNLAGVANGQHVLTDRGVGNLMYQTHLYPDKLADQEVADSVAAVSQNHPIYVGEWGDGGINDQYLDSAATNNQNMLAYLNQHNFSWTAWAFTPDLGGDSNYYNLLTSWDANATTSDYGVFVKADLAAHANNQAPTVVTPASAAANPVTGTSTGLSVLGGDAGGEAGLTYAWTKLSGPAGVSFSDNSSNSAKNTTVTFAGAGTYTFEATITNTSGLTATSDVSLTVNQTLTSIVVTPGSVSVSPGGSQQFAAQALDQFGNALAVQPAFSWSVDNGTVDGNGLYQAPAAAGNATLTAASGGVNGTAAVSVAANVSALASFADTQDWGTGFTGYITITNTGNTDINGWTLEFDFTGNIYDIWDGQIVSHVGNHYVIQNVSWDATIAAGQSVNFGFNADWGAFQAVPTNYVLNGVPIQSV